MQICKKFLENYSMTDVILINSTANYLHAGCSMTMLGLRKLLHSSNFNIIFEVDHGNQFDEKLISFLHKNEDIKIVINGEGTFHGKQNYMVKILEFCKPFLKRTILLNSQMHKINQNFISYIRDMQLVQIRNKTDWSNLINHGVNAIYCPDMLFFSGIEPPSDKHLNFSVFTDSQDSSQTKLIWRDYASLKSKKIWVNFHYQQISAGSHSFSYRKCFLKNFPGVSSKLHYKLQHILRKETLSDLISTFSSANRIYTGRYHAVCFAILLKKNFTAYSSNTPKIKNLLLDRIGEENLDDSCPWSIDYDENISRNFFIEAEKKFLELKNALNF